jgi:hypothetical protein
MTTVDEVVAGLTKVDANILARFASGDPIDAITAATGQRRKEVERVITGVGRLNAAYAKRLALAWQRANSPGRIGTAPAAEPSTSARLREVERELAAVDAAAGRDIAKPEEPLVDRVADLLRGRTEATERALELAAQLAEMAELRADAVDQVRRVARVRDLVQAELASALSELERLRAAADGYVQALPTTDVILTRDAQHCAPCGWTSSYETHDHPTIPVRVVIHRTEGPTT